MHKISVRQSSIAAVIRPREVAKLFMFNAFINGILSVGPDTSATSYFVAYDELQRPCGDGRDTTARRMITGIINTDLAVGYEATR